MNSCSHDWLGGGWNARVASQVDGKVNTENREKVFECAVEKETNILSLC